MKRFIAVVMVIFIGWVNLFAQGSNWKLDKAHSKAVFTIQHMVISEVLGYFKDFDISLNAIKVI